MNKPTGNGEAKMYNKQKTSQLKIIASYSCIQSMIHRQTAEANPNSYCSQYLQAAHKRIQSEVGKMIKKSKKNLEAGKKFSSKISNGT